MDGWKELKGEVSRTWQWNVRGVGEKGAEDYSLATAWMLLALTDMENNERKIQFGVGMGSKGISGFYYELAMRPPACYFFLFDLFSYPQNGMFVLDLE